MEGIEIIPEEDRVERDAVRESYVEGKVNDYAKKIGGFYQRKYVTPGHDSSPDRIYIERRNGKIVRIFFIEFKAPGKDATDAQKEEHELMRSYGIDVYVCDNIEQGKAILAGLC